MPAVDIPAARRVRPLSRAIARARERGIPMYAIAEEARLSKAHLSQIASGATQPSRAAAERIAAALGEDIHELFPEFQ